MHSVRQQHKGNITNNVSKENIERKKERCMHEGAPPAGTTRAGQPIIKGNSNTTNLPRGRPRGHCPQWGHPLWHTADGGEHVQNARWIVVASSTSGLT